MDKIKELKEKPLRYTWAYPPQSYHCRHIDLEKSKPFINTLTGNLENKEGLPFWKPIERYLANLDDFLGQLKNLDLEEYVVKCKSCGLELVTFFVEKNTTGREDGILGLKYTQHLLAYRPREDGLLGLECVCGYGDTRLSTEEKLKYPDKFPDNVLSTSEDEAHFNNENSVFLAVKKETTQLISGKEVQYGF